MNWESTFENFVEDLRTFGFDFVAAAAHAEEFSDYALDMASQVVRSHTHQISVGEKHNVLMPNGTYMYMLSDMAGGSNALDHDFDENDEMRVKIHTALRNYMRDNPQQYFVCVLRDDDNPFGRRYLNSPTELLKNDFLLVAMESLITKMLCRRMPTD